jgi:curved DNA-binding protein CbpA
LGIEQGMKLDSKYFDSIRCKPERERQTSQHAQACSWPECSKAGAYRAPKGRGREGEYHLFCLDHVRDYNKSYNYFSGMSDDQVAAYQKASITGHRPTWSSGINAWAATGFRSQAESHMGGFKRDFETADPFGFFRADAGAGASGQRAEPQRPIRNAERKSFGVLDLPVHSTAEEIKARFKALVKLHHPDSNGGDRGSEDRLREVIQAYNYLKQAGFC